MQKGKCNIRVYHKLMHKQGHVSHVYRPTFWALSKVKGFESLRPLLQGRHGELHGSRFRARHDVSPTLKPSLRHFKSSEKKTDYLCGDQLEQFSKRKSYKNLQTNFLKFFYHLLSCTVLSVHSAKLSVRKIYLLNPPLPGEG